MRSASRCRSGSRALSLLAGLAVLGASPGAAGLTEFSVRHTGDSGPGSLRQAILDANAMPGFDRIVFVIPGAGPHTIQPLSALPVVSDPVVIDGTTQSGSSVNTNPPELGTNAVLMIELDGSLAGAGASGLFLDVDAGGSAVRGLVINRFDQDGISIVGSSGNLVAGNFLGTDRTGRLALGNDQGVLISNGAQANRVGREGSAADNGQAAAPSERNLISGNRRTGVRIQRGSVEALTQDNVVAGNLIGTDASGRFAVPNGSQGVLVINGAKQNRIGSNLDGAADAAERNVVSGNGNAGILLADFLAGGTSGNQVAGNYVGTDVSGAAALPNLRGVELNAASGNDIVSNVVCGNLDFGVALAGGADGNLVQGNRIGVDAVGEPLGNGFGGVFVASGSDNQIGGGSATGPNTIAYNGTVGVSVAAGTGNRIAFNSIHSNTSLGIDLAGDGVTQNDPLDADTGANELQNFPFLEQLTSAGASTTVVGHLESTPGKPYRLRFYANSVPDPSGHGEGERPIGAGATETDAAGLGKFVATVAPLLPGEVVTATATDSFTGDTSEFSAFAKAASEAALLEELRQLGTSGTDRAEAVVVDETGLYLAGTTSGDLGGPSAGGTDAFVQKIDRSTGSVLWTRQFGSGADDTASSLGLTPPGVEPAGIFVGGDTAGALPGQTHLGETDDYVRRYDRDGNVIWTRQFGTSGTELGVIKVNSPVVFGAGATTGAFPGFTNAGGLDAYYVQHNMDGNLTVVDQFGTTGDDRVFGIGTSPSVGGPGFERVYIAGDTTGVFPGESGAGGTDAFVRAHDPDGVGLWTRQFGSSADDRAEGVGIPDGVDGVFVGGTTDGALPGQTSLGGSDAFLRRYDLDGNEVFTRQFGTGGDEMAIDTLNSPAVFAIGGTTGAFPGQQNLGGVDAFFRKFDLDGNVLATRQFGTAGDDQPLGGFTDSEAFFAVGETTGELPGETSAGGTDAFWVEIVPGLDVAIDVKPADSENVVNLGARGSLPVAIFSRAGFDATTIDPATVTLAGAPVVQKKKGLQAAAEDVDGDGLVDLVVHVQNELLELAPGDSEALLEAETFGGSHLRGLDGVVVKE